MPYQAWAPVTPDDFVDLGRVTQALYVAHDTHGRVSARSSEPLNSLALLLNS